MKYRYLEYSIIIIQDKNVLIAQIIWYFIEGFHYRSNEYPFGSRENYIKYIVPMEAFFIKATKRTGGGLRFHLFQMVIITKRNTLLPCSYDEYLGACNQELREMVESTTKSI
jgi:hypothetical protein